MKKKISIILMGVMVMSLMSGCIKRDSMQDITIHTTVYPIEYVTNYLYGDNSDVMSIYPDGVDIKSYTFTDKQIKDYSDTSLFIFNGNDSEKDLVSKFSKYNRSIKIINATASIEMDYAIEEMWLNPANLLMLAQNVKNGLNEYINNGYLKTEINENYEQLKIDISNLDAKIKLMAENSSDPTIVVSSDIFKFLGDEDKYKFNVISLDGDSNAKAVEQTRLLASKGTVEYLFIPKGTKLNDELQKLAKELKLEVVELHTLTNITSEERKNKDDYITLMNENLELIRNEIYE